MRYLIPILMVIVAVATITTFFIDPTLAGVLGLSSLMTILMVFNLVTIMKIR